MSERFDVLFEGLEEKSALQLVLANPEELSNPVDKYMAATRLGASTTEASLNVLIEAVGLDPENLFNRITRRKVLEALGRRKDQRALPALFQALSFDDEPAVVNAVDSIAQIAAPLEKEQCQQLLHALHGGDNQKRSVIQCHTRLGLSSGSQAIGPLESDDNPLIAGAALAYAARVNHEQHKLQPLVAQLTDAMAGRRRSAVIDLGDAGDVSRLDDLIRSPVSMPLRAKSAFQLVDPEKTGDVPEAYAPSIKRLLQDDPRLLALDPSWISADGAESIEKNLQHRDEGRQYGGAVQLLQLPEQQQLAAIDAIHSKFWSDYGANYLITSVVGLARLQQRSDLVRTALAETLPQYAKSRVAAAWACLSLKLIDQVSLLQEIQRSSRWIPLKWSCEQVLKELS